MPLPKFSLQFAFSWSVYFSNRTESYSSQIEFAGLHGITENQATYIYCGGEARAKKRARPPATCRKASRGKTGADTGPEGCGSPAVFRPRNTATTRWSTKNTIMTVHVNPITQAAPSQRRIISISEASNQLLFHYQKFFVEWICWRINIFLKSCSRSKKLQPGGKPNSFAFRNPGRPRRSINCSRDGSRTASRFTIQVNRDGRSNCSQSGSRRSAANKPCLCRGDSRRSSGQTRRRSASDGCRKGRWETWSCWQCGCFHPQLSWYSSSALIVSIGLFGWWDAAHRFLPVYIINFTTGLRAYIHTFMTIFPDAVSHSLLSIIFNTACLHVT